MNVHHSVNIVVGRTEIAKTKDAVNTVLKLHYLLQRHQCDLAAMPWFFTLKSPQWLLAHAAQSFLLVRPFLASLCCKVPFVRCNC